MAPNRKKKKPTSNPSRGFATTSIVSKTKSVVDSDVDGDILPATDEGLKFENDEHVNAQPDRAQQKELHELSPDQLEAQLEDSELQLLVEKHSERTKKNVLRQVTRLQTERRLLRSQALSLNTSRWLPEELLQLITSLIEKPTNRGHPLVNPVSGVNRKAASADDLILQLWSLRRTLIDLGFLQYRVEETISRLIRDKHMFERADAGSMKEGLWGIDECLNFLAITCTTDEVPDYETYRTGALEKQLRKSTQLLDSFSFGTAPCPW